MTLPVELAPAIPGHPPLVAKPADFARVPGTVVIHAGRQCWVVEPDRLAQLDHLRAPAVDTDTVPAAWLRIADLVGCAPHQHGEIVGRVDALVHDHSGPR